MKIVSRAVAGSLESNDALVTVSPGEGGLVVEVESIVFNQFGPQIERVARDCADRLGVSDASIHINDKGAISCTLQARVETALHRGAEVRG